MEGGGGGGGYSWYFCVDLPCIWPLTRCLMWERWSTFVFPVCLFGEVIDFPTFGKNFAIWRGTSGDVQGRRIRRFERGERQGGVRSPWGGWLRGHVDVNRVRFRVPVVCKVRFPLWSMTRKARAESRTINGTLGVLPVHACRLRGSTDSNGGCLRAATIVWIFGW